ncbi:CarboxypepD_reg-like domain-containing protein [Robiginitalea myxolifaciens]|uniref:CarboxypepD_reg-like domain-containing protein n=1 Tax=Robiginitalea myxolifaciens TaxID=400055 RepID=A0A1I6FN30_9FLAO|nr:DUF5686 and carboxypeptidase regulatory-like domain-containing protein [Robiginitalea myxolifaciens]SFR31340.1 CarboxypepD_reg-like domain-containing protein [Robiginitalea myxolifaciens]
MKILDNRLLLLALLFTVVTQAQITGRVTDSKNEPLAFVNIYLEGSLTGTITNDNGYYELDISQTGTFTLIYKFLGFRTRKETVTVSTYPYTLDVVLQEEEIALDEVQVAATENPANEIIRNAIAERRRHREEIMEYRADFYSKGLIRIKDAPERILGQDLGDLGGGLDSTRSGILYLSETISEIERQNNEFNEKIIASKVSGDDNGFSFNNASDVEFNFYENSVEFGTQLISPIADNAFSYYRYRLLGTFYDDQNNLINQIEVIPRRPGDRVFAGIIYIVENSWAFYAIDVKVTGEQTQILPIDTVRLTQNFNYDVTSKTWLKVLQRMDFQYSIFGFKGDGRFTAGYKNYELNPGFAKGHFSNEILSFDTDANKKDSTYWQALRPVPLTQEESEDYVFKDSIQVIRKSQQYLDSVDAKGNKFTLGSLLFGYTYTNSFKEKTYTLTSPVANVAFNTVQGWQGTLGLEYLKLSEEKGTRLNLAGQLNYGLSDKRLRPVVSASYRFNNFSRPYLSLEIGNQAAQFNENNPITPFGNTLATLFFESNLAKFYDRSFAELNYSQELVNGIYLFARFSYEDRSSLFNTSDYVLIDNEGINYTSNNPLAPQDFINGAIEAHNILKLSINTRIRFGQKYINYPTGRFSYSPDRYPTLYLGYEKGFAGSEAENNFDQLKIRLSQDFDVGSLGRFGYNLRAGTFLNAEGISFVDFQHFNGNRTRITRGNYLNSFFLLPYYEFSTNRDYFEGHFEHNFKGAIMNRIPLLKHLKSNLILNFNLLSTSNNLPYSECGISLGNLGWKKFRFLRVGYVFRHFEGRNESGINFGIQF